MIRWTGLAPWVFEFHYLLGDVHGALSEARDIEGLALQALTLNLQALTLNLQALTLNPTPVGRCTSRVE